MKLRKFHGTWSDTKFNGTLVPPNGLSPNSIEFHGTLAPPNEISLSSMEFHFKWAPFQKGAISNDRSVPWNSMEYSMEFHGTLVPPNEISLSSMEFHGTLRLSFHSILCYPGLPWDIPWNSMELWSRQIKNHRIPWNIPWNSMELWYRKMKYNLFPWNTMKYSMEFRGTLVPPNEISLSSMKFHGTLRLSFYSIPCYPGLSWGIPWNSMELWSRQIRKSPSSK